MAGIYIENSSNIYINEGYFDTCDVAIEAKNSSNIKVNRANINNCNKGIRLENCWGSELTNINIGSFSRIGINGYRLSNLAILVRHHMIN